MYISAWDEKTREFDSLTVSGRDEERIGVLNYKVISVLDFMNVIFATLCNPRTWII